MVAETDRVREQISGYASDPVSSSTRALPMLEKLKKMDEAAFASLDLQKYLNDLQEDQEND